jgi:hypothetical protein
MRINMDNIIDVSQGIEILTKELNYTFNKAYEDWSIRDHNLVEALCELESRKEELSCLRR